MPKSKYKGKRRRKMHKFQLNEISAVDRPAQGEATVSIMKRHVMKNAKLTTEDNGHQHGIDFYDYECGNTHGSTTYQDEHSHPWIINQSGELVIGVADGHTHGLGEREIELFKNIVVNSDDGEIAKGKGDAMSDAEKGVADLEKRLEEMGVQLEKATAISQMSDVEKSYMSALGEDDAEAFVKMSSGDRAAEIKKSEAEDPEFYKSADGTVYLKSQEAFGKMAKRADEADAKLAKMAADAKDAEFTKRAGDELSALPGEVSVRAAVLKAIDGIEGAAEILKAANDAAQANLGEVGSSEGDSSDGDGDAYSKYKDEVSKVAKAQSISQDDAEDIVKREQPKLYADAVEAG